MNAPTIAGGWLGTYVYAGAAARMPPTRFEATFTPGKTPDDPFTGSILDDGPLGEARVENGSQNGLRVRFTKRYLGSDSHGSAAAQPVDYEGTLSEDGRFMRGTWQLVTKVAGRPRPFRTHGVWEAHRMWNAQAEPEVRVEEDDLVLAGRRLVGTHGALP